MRALPFVMPNPFSFQKRVFAHYFPSFPLSIDNQLSDLDYYNEQYLAPDGENNSHVAYGGWLRARPLPVPIGSTIGFQLANMQFEVQDAIARGITGFVFDITSFTDAMDSNGRLHTMITAANVVDTRFAIVPMLDMSALVGLTQAQAVQLIASLASLPIARTPDGRLLIAAFNALLQPLSFWQSIISALNTQNVNVAFIPVLLGSPTSSTLDPISLGTGGWGTALPDVASSPASYLTPILTQQFRPKDQKFWESQNFDTFINGWVAAIKGGGPFAQVITWNDFSESGQVQPYTDATLALDIGTGFYDLLAYYATWFISGQQPTITRDVLYWCYRRMQSTAAHPNQIDNFTPVQEPETSNIELLAFLTAPGNISINGASIAAPAGITSFKQLTAPGNPTFALQRNGSNVFQGRGPIQIYGAAGWPAGTLDLTYWSGSFSS